MGGSPWEEGGTQNQLVMTIIGKRVLQRPDVGRYDI